MFSAKEIPLKITLINSIGIVNIGQVFVMGFRDKLEGAFKSSERQDNGIVEKNEGKGIALSSKQVLFVCDSNTVISPIAEAIFNKSSDHKAFSAGLDAQNGEMASHNARMACENHGIDLSSHRTRNINDFPINEMDLVLTSTAQIRDALRLKYPDLEIFTIREYAGGYSDLDISDPLGGDYSQYGKCFNQIDEAIQRILADESETPVHARGFRYLDELIHEGGCEIMLDSDIILSDGEESEYGYGIELDIDDLVIDGQNHIIDAKGKAQIFRNSATNVVLKNLTLKRGFAEGGDGGAIQNNGGKLTISNSTLTDNGAISKGGAVINDDGELLIIDSVISKNTAMKAGAIENVRGEMKITTSTFIKNTSREFGGAIYHFGGKLEIEDSKFSENNVGLFKGGAIYSRGELSLLRCDFNGNSSNQDGGAIFNVDALSIIECRFNANSSLQNGGAMFSENAKVAIFDSEFNRNSSGNEGGAIFNKEGEFSIRDSKFNENSSRVNGGAISHALGQFTIIGCEVLNNRSQMGIVHNQEYFPIYNSIFRHNSAEDVIFNEGSESRLSIVHGQFAYNDVSRSVIFNEGYCAIEKIDFKQNLLNGDSNNIANLGNMNLLNLGIEDGRKSIYNENYIFVKSYSQDILDIIHGDGTVEFYPPPWHPKLGFGYLDKQIHEATTGEIVLDEDIILENYEIDFYEGGIELDIDGLVIDGQGKSIDGKGNSRIFMVTAKDITLKNIIFKNGHSLKSYPPSCNEHGGAIRISNGASVKIQNCKFINNESDGSGGALYNRHGEVSISDSAFNENAAKTSGAIFNGGDLGMSHSKLTDNSSKEEGGAIFNSGNLSISGSDFRKNRAQNGGVIYGHDGKLFISDSLFSENGANLEGGAIRNISALKIFDSTFNLNDAGRGGAICSSGDVSLSRSVFNANAARSYGGAIYAKEHLAIYFCRIDENTAEGSGGAIFNLGDLSITESKLINNAAKTGGGAIENDRGQSNIAESLIGGNAAEWGGAITNSGEMRISESKFNENVADRYGGGINNEHGAELEVSNSIFIKNIANGIENFGNGGAIRNSSEKSPKIENCIFRQNKPNDVFESLD